VVLQLDEQARQDNSWRFIRKGRRLFLEDAVDLVKGVVFLPKCAGCYAKGGGCCGKGGGFCAKDVD